MTTPGYARPPATSGKATAALVFAILSWVGCPIVGAIIALVLASFAAREIRTSGGAVGGAGLVTASRVIACVNVVFGLFMAAVVAIVFLGSGAGELEPVGDPFESVVVVGV